MKLAVVLLQILLLVAITAVVAGGEPPSTPSGQGGQGAQTGTPGPAPGPIVVIKGGAGGASISFEVNGIAQVLGPPTAGLLRSDFIGHAVDYLTCFDGQAWTPVDSVSITDRKNERYRLVIERTALNTFWWTLEEKQPPPLRTIALRPDTPTPGQVPGQFLELSGETMRAGSTGCAEVKFRVLTYR